MTVLWSEGGRRAHRRSGLKLAALAALSLVFATAFSTSGWAVDGGYGPGGTSSSGGGGTFGNVIVAMTVGPNGGNVFGRFRGTTIDILIPAGQFTTKELVEIASSHPNCKALIGRETIIGLDVFITNREHTQDTFSEGAKAIISSPKITSDSLVLSANHNDCAILSGLEIETAHVIVPLQLSSAFVVTSPIQHNEYFGNGGQGTGGVAGWTGINFDHEWMPWS